MQNHCKSYNKVAYTYIVNGLYLIVNGPTKWYPKIWGELVIDSNLKIFSV